MKTTLKFLLTFVTIFSVSLLSASIFNDDNDISSDYKENYEMKVGDSLHGGVILELNKIKDGKISGIFQGDSYVLKQGESKEIKNEYVNYGEYITKGKITAVKVDKDSAYILLELKQIYIYSIIVRLVLSLIAAIFLMLMSKVFTKNLLRSHLK